MLSPSLISVYIYISYLAIAIYYIKRSLHALKDSSKNALCGQCLSCQTLTGDCQCKTHLSTIRHVFDRLPITNITRSSWKQ